MVNNELAGGIELGLSKGTPLNNILASFFNAGYSREEIDEAARIAQQNISQIQISSQPQQTSQQPVKTLPQKQIQQEQPIQKSTQFQQKPSQTQTIQMKQQPPRQNVSSYGEKMPKKPKGKFLIALLIFLLILVGAVAISYFFFKDEIESLLGGLIFSLI